MSVALPHAVAHTDLGEDVLRLAGLILNLAADVRHVHAEDLVVGLGLRPPELADDEVIGQHLARVFAEQGDDLILVDRELGVLTALEHLVLVIVDRQLADGELARLRDLRIGQGRARVADGRSDAGEELRRAEGLDEVVVRAVVEGFNLVVLVRAGGDDDHRQVRPLAHGFEHLQPVHIRQPQIQNDQIRAVRGDHGQRLLAAADDDGVIAVGRENHGDEVADALLVLNDQNLILDFHGVPPSLADIPETRRRSVCCCGP